MEQILKTKKEADQEQALTTKTLFIAVFQAFGKNLVEPFLCDDMMDVEKLIKTRCETAVIFSVSKWEAKREEIIQLNKVFLPKKHVD